MVQKEKLRKKYDKIWEQIRYKKTDEISSLTNEVIKILEKHIDDKLLFHGDYEKINFLYE